MKATQYEEQLYMYMAIRAQEIYHNYHSDHNI